MKFIFNKNSIYNTRYFVYTYNTNDIRIVKVKSCRKSGFELIKKDTNDIVDINSEESKRCSLSRTKRNIRELCLCNDFEYFATITINSANCDRYSLDNCQTLLKKTLKKIKRKNNNFRYLFITEKHKDGAFHFHGLIGGISSEEFNINNNGYLTLSYFDNAMGYNSFSLIKNYTKCCNYITKYITKDCIKNSHNQIYISSRGLTKASREEFKFINFEPSFSNEYCDILDIQLENLDFNKNLDLIYQLKEGK